MIKYFNIDNYFNFFNIKRHNITEHIQIFKIIIKLFVIVISKKKLIKINL